jgi:hypothetical protein
MRVFYLTAIKEWIINKYESGYNIWKEIAEQMGIGVDSFHSQDNYISFQRLKFLLDLSAKKIKKSEFDTSVEFMQYWMTDFAPRLFQSLAKSTSSIKDFLFNFVKLNNELCQFIPNNSFISKIDLNEKDKKTLTVIYGNEKSLVDIIGILRGISSVYKEQYSIKKINQFSIEIHFS